MKYMDGNIVRLGDKVELYNIDLYEYKYYRNRFGLNGYYGIVTDITEWIHVNNSSTGWHPRVIKLVSSKLYRNILCSL